MRERKESGPQMTRRGLLGLLACLAAPRMAAARVNQSSARFLVRAKSCLRLASEPGRCSMCRPEARTSTRRSQLSGASSRPEAASSTARRCTAARRSGWATSSLQSVRQRDPFLATKIWTTGRAAGESQLADSHRLMRAKTLDLVQVHNLQDVDTHLPTLRAARDAGTHPIHRRDPLRRKRPRWSSSA